MEAPSLEAFNAWCGSEQLDLGGVWFNGHAGVGLDDLGGLSQLKQFYDFMMLGKKLLD